MTMQTKINCPCCGSENTRLQNLPKGDKPWYYCNHCVAEWRESLRQPPTSEAVWEWFCDRLRRPGREIFVSASGKLKTDKPYSQQYRTILNANEMEALGWPPATRSQDGE